MEMYQIRNSLIINHLLEPCNKVDLIEDNPDIFSLMNADGVIQIGSVLYRYDYCTQSVFVMLATNASNTTNYNNFLEGKTVTNIVGEFPVYVDVLEAVAAGYKTMPDSNTVSGNEIFERGPWIGFNFHRENMYIRQHNQTGTDQKMDAKLSYDAFAFYFHYYGKEKYQEHGTFIQWVTSSDGDRSWYVNYDYSYHRKGRNNSDFGSGTLNPSNSGENKVEKTFYSGSRGLKWGNSLWDVENVSTSKVRIERDYPKPLGWNTYTEYESNTGSSFKANNYFKPGVSAADQQHHSHAF